MPAVCQSDITPRAGAQRLSVEAKDILSSGLGWVQDSFLAAIAEVYLKGSTGGGVAGVRRRNRQLARIEGARLRMACTQEALERFPLADPSARQAAAFVRRMIAAAGTFCRTAALTENPGSAEPVVDLAAYRLRRKAFAREGDTVTVSPSALSGRA